MKKYILPNTICMDVALLRVICESTTKVAAVKQGDPLTNSTAAHAPSRVAASLYD